MLLLDEKDLELARRIIENSIRSRIKKIGAKGVIVAISGGIDSALVARLGGEALGDKVLGLILPEEDVNLPEDVEHAKQVAEEVGINYKIIKINEALEPFARIFSSLGLDDGNRKRLAWGNVKPKVRMIINYMVANSENRIVLGTSNKTELLLGYSTKFGDSGVDIQPIGDLYKTQVKQLARYIKIPKTIIDKAPTAGLWVGQTDEKELGATYEEIDKILYLLVEEGYSVKEVSQRLNVDLDSVTRIYERMRINEHKRNSPTITRLTSMCLDKDWRYPVERE